MKTNLIKKITAGVMAAAIAIGSMFVGGNSIEVQAKWKPTQICTMTKAVRTAPNKVEVYVKQTGKKSPAKNLKNLCVEVKSSALPDGHHSYWLKFKKVSSKMYKATIKSELLVDCKKAVVSTYDCMDGHWMDKTSATVKAAKGLAWKKVCTQKAQTVNYGYEVKYDPTVGDYVKVPVMEKIPAEYEYRWVKVKK